MTKAHARKGTAAPQPQRRKIDKTADTAIAQAPRGDDDLLLDTASTAVWLGVSHQWLELARCKGYGPRYVKVTNRLVRYRKGDIVEYLKSRTTKVEGAR
jgi:predicted DNA-binding transcriptional regulator AlpA